MTESSLVILLITEQKEDSDNGHHHENFDERKGPSNLGTAGKAVAQAHYSQLNIHCQSGLPDELFE